MNQINLYVHMEGDQFDRVIMPDEFGEMQEPAPAGPGWFAVSWPLNPRFTGRAVILLLLNEDKLTREKLSKLT